MVELEESLIDALQRMDLDSNEAQIYYTLIKYGKRGTIVRKLREELPFIERTTLYSILKRLIEKECVKENLLDEEGKNLKTFIATDPKEYFNKIFIKKKKELDYLKDVRVKVIETLQNVYVSGLNLTYDDLDPFIQPYFESLLKNGWIVKTQRKEEGINILGVKGYYEYHLQHPNLSNKIQMIGFVVSIYNNKVEDDELTITFLIKQLKKIINEMHKADFKKIEMIDGEVEMFGKIFPSIIIRAEEKQSNNYVDFGNTAILPIKNKVFFIWEELNHENPEFDKEELHNLLEEIVELVLRAEGISFRKK